MTNKILSRYVNRIMITFQESEKYFKYPKNCIDWQSDTKGI